MDTDYLVLEMIQRFLCTSTHARDRGHIIAEPKSVELVILHDRVGLRDKAVECTIFTSQVKQDLKRDIAFARCVLSGWRERLHAIDGHEVSISNE